MLDRDQQMFLLVPNASNERVLHPGRTIEVDGLTRVCEFEEPLSPAVGDNVVVFSERREKFLQQGAVVSLIRQTEPASIVAFLLTGDPVSADSRNAYRVSMATSGLQVKVEKEPRCPLMDVSPEGFSAITAQSYAIGSRVSVIFTIGGTTVDEKVRVQTLKPRPDGRFRFGFLVEDRRSPLRRLLQHMHTSVQQQQLRRLAGTA